MELRFERVDLRDDRAALIDWLTAESWPFHVNCAPTKADIETRLEAGAFDEPNSEMYWINGVYVLGIGLLHIYDLDDVVDGAPGFDLRIREEFRNKGIGTQAVSWLSAKLFKQYPALRRIEATTRLDNAAMRATFRKCGYVKESHFRLAWPVRDGEPVDSVGYGLIRSDWENSTITPIDWHNEDH